MHERITKFADIILPVALPNLFTYRVPSEWNERIISGIRVIVPFGKNKLYTGIVRAVHEKPPIGYEAKYLDSILDEIPIISEIQFKFWEWMALYYMCHIGEVMQAALPSGLKITSETKVILSEATKNKPDIKNLHINEYKIIEALIVKEILSLDEIAKIIAIKNPLAIVKRMVDKGFLLLYESIDEKYKPKLTTYLALNKLYQDETTLNELLNQLEKKAYKQMEIVMRFLQRRQMEIVKGHDKTTAYVKKKDIVGTDDTSAFNALVKKNVFDITEIDTGRFKLEIETNYQKVLNDEQQKALFEVKQNFSLKKHCLLHGLTGSGKTEVYLQLAADTIATGKQVLYLLPEIALTGQIIHRVQQKFGTRAGIYHSRMSNHERVEVWQNILNDCTSNELNERPHFDILVGARSSLFLPLHNVGLIIVDEEHDASYKQQDPSPRYHARDAAIYLAQLYNANILLGTATPSLETYYLAKQDKFGYVKLENRFGEAVLPHWQIIDTKEEERNKTMHQSFSEPLVNAINTAVSNHEQVILFQNRRGFSPYTECQECAWTPTCLNCDVSLTYHKTLHLLRCHYCGYSTKPHSECASCGSSHLQFKGLGTEKIEEEVEILFPTARVARLDLDTSRSRQAYNQLMNDFTEGNIDILIGTQMVTKGLDFDNVNVVGIINADQVLKFPDFRSHERAFQTLVQVSGRAGRKKKQGKVYLQTAQPYHPVIQFAMNNAIDALYEKELLERVQFHYPPFVRIIEFNILSPQRELTDEAAQLFTEALKAMFKDLVLGPQTPSVGRIKNQFLKRTILKVKKEWPYKKVREEISQLLHHFSQQNNFKKVKIQVDVDPV
jgi:primosomal protein N' (replication factor Y) (superfamily II helicase)